MEIIWGLLSSSNPDSENMLKFFYALKKKSSMYNVSLKKLVN